MSRSKRVDRREIAGEFERVRADFHRLVGGASSEGFDRPSEGTRWTNEQLLFHMVFGYMVVRRLLILVRILGWLPDGVSRRFAAAQNASTRLFDEVNYRGNVPGGPGIQPSPHGAAMRQGHRFTPAESGGGGRERAAARHALP